MGLAALKQRIYNELIKKKIIKKLKKTEQRFILVGTPLHGNLGDHAIALAELEYFSKEFGDRTVIEIPRYYFELFNEQLKKHIKGTDILLIHGGGFLGTLWIGEEYFLRKIIKSYPYNPIVIMPQTVYYADDDAARLELKKSEEIYNNHKNLHICAREKYSYDFMKQHYNQCEILLVPDIVLYLLNKMKFEEKIRTGVLFCFRRDKERQVGDEYIHLLNKIVANLGEEITVTDTVVKHNVYIEDRQDEVKKKWKNFASAKLVITDRLHGMVFSAITGTPCIVFKNCNYKVEGVYEWIKEWDYIQLVKDVEEFKIALKKMYGEKSSINTDLDDKFAPLTDCIKNLLACEMF